MSAHYRDYTNYNVRSWNAEQNEDQSHETTEDDEFGYSSRELYQEMHRDYSAFRDPSHYTVYPSPPTAPRNMRQNNISPPNSPPSAPTAPRRMRLVSPTLAPTAPRSMRNAQVSASTSTSGSLPSPPSAPRRMLHTTRSSPRERTRSLSPTFPPLPSKPSDEYIVISKEPSNLIDPPSLRKLLILDLNGSLLYRSHARSGHQRPVHPRPYMPSFRNYLFCKETKSWLDVMVWSSARPHNVQNMVDACFQDLRNNLLDVWARDTLGLSREEYAKKTQTTKFLERLWMELPVAENGQGHTARTSVLLDDSCLKARLEPYNHVSLKEYDENLYAHDRKVHHSLKLAASLQSDDEEIPGSPTRPVSPPSSPKARRVFEGSVVHRMLERGHQSSRHYDETLLGVIGILEEAKNQSNIAGWIRSGGLTLDKTPKLQTSRSVEDTYTHHTYGHTDGDGSSRTTSPTSTMEGKVKALNVSDIDSPLSSLWFHDEDLFRFWVFRGRKALEELNIKEEHGFKSY